MRDAVQFRYLGSCQCGKLFELAMSPSVESSNRHSGQSDKKFCPEQDIMLRMDRLIAKGDKIELVEADFVSRRKEKRSQIAQSHINLLLYDRDH